MKNKNVVIKQNGHCQKLVSGIFNVCRSQGEGENNGYVEDPRLQTSGMTAYLMSGSHPTYKNCSGFTLIELLVVVLIIGILAAVALPQYQKAVLKSQSVEALSTINSIEKAIELHVLEYGMPQNVIDIVISSNRLAKDGYTIGFSGLGIKETGKSCPSDGFCYIAGCAIEECQIKAEYRKGKKKLYTLGAKKNFMNQGKWELTCMSTAQGNQINACGIFQGMEQLDCSQQYYDEDFEEYVSPCDVW